MKIYLSQEQVLLVRDGLALKKERVKAAVEGVGDGPIKEAIRDGAESQIQQLDMLLTHFNAHIERESDFG